MNQAFTSKDILEMSIQAKARGVELYLALAKNSSNYYVGKLFVELAKDEQRHKHELEKWLTKAKDKGRMEAYPGERSLFLKALVDENAFNCDETRKKMLETTISEEEALRAGINFEKDFMLFLHELKRHVSEKESAVIDKLIDEEIDHLKEIIKIKDKLEKK
jgi:rubrerythrin